MKVSFMNFYFSLQEMHATIGFGGGCQDAFKVYYCLDTVTQCWNIEQWKKNRILTETNEYWMHLYYINAYIGIYNGANRV